MKGRVLIMSFNIKSFGALGNGVSLDQMAIQEAIDKCSADGGGTVSIPAGRYLCGTIHLKSNVCLYLEMGAVIVASDKSELFPEICKTPYGNLPGQIQALIWAEKVENVTITGYGIIDGGGNQPLTGEQAANVMFRPALIFYRDCKNVKFTGITLKDPSFWTLHLMRCEDVLVQGINIWANQGRINTDGIDPDGCKNVIISNCNIKTGDDCIVIKSTEGDACKNITVTNCILSSTQAALKIGTEALGDIRNITFSNCVIYNTDVGLALYMKDGSTYENIIFSNIVAELRNEFPVLIDITPRYYKNPRIGRIRNVSFRDIIINSQGRCFIEGHKESPVKNITFENITWNVTDICKTEGVTKPQGAKRVEIDPNRNNYADKPYQFMAINAEDLQYHNIKVYDVSGGKSVDRGIVFLDSIHNLKVMNIESKLNVPPGIEAFLSQNCSNAIIDIK